MKKKLLFVIESLACAGAEKSLVTLLNNIDYSRFDVDLQLFSYGGGLETLVPKNVNILPELPYFSLASKQISKGFLLNPKFTISRLRYSIELRKKTYSNPQKAIIFWKNTKKCFKKSQKNYDVAIAYAQGIPTFYVADCINAKKKFAWVNVTYKPEGEYRNFVADYYKEYKNVVCVSESSKETFDCTFFEHKNKSIIILDINDYGMANRLAELESDATKEMSSDGIKILTVGRLAAQKGYDIATSACEILKKNNVNFTWYVLGKGPLDEELRKLISKKQIDDKFILLGTRDNPYPYYKQADIYVQTSRFEGFGLAIAEARMLNVPVVTTEFDAVYAQMINGENGLVVEMTAQAVADGIQKLINDKDLYDHIKEYLKNEKKGNTEEIEKFYELIE